MEYAQRPLREFTDILRKILKEKDNNYHVVDDVDDENGFYQFTVVYLYGDDKLLKPLKLDPANAYNPEDFAKVIIEFFDNKNNFVQLQ